MFKTIKNDMREANIAWLRIRYNPTTGAGEVAPHGVYSSFEIAPDVRDRSEQEEVAVEKGYEMLQRALETYRERAREMGIRLK